MDSKQLVGERLTPESENRRTRKSNRRSIRFIRGPIPLQWIERACKLRGKVGRVILALWYARGLSGEPVALTPTLLASFGVTSRTGRRVLRRLEAAGLVSVERRRGRSPRVTTTQVEGEKGATSGPKTLSD